MTIAALITDLQSHPNQQAQVKFIIKDKVNSEDFDNEFRDNGYVWLAVQFIGSNHPNEVKIFLTI